jgi:pimeloyl-ACP methyl ester carboxylesterase
LKDSWTHHVRLVNDFRMHYVIAGSGAPLILLHGWPQSWYEWRKVIPALAERFTVVAPDLRGLGDSGKPMSGYDKRTLATDVRELIRQLGFERVGVMAHDWGGAVAFYLCYDNRELVERLFILDMIPGIARAGEPLDLAVAVRLWHVFWHGGNSDFAQKMVSRDVAGYITHFLTTTDYNYSPAVFSPEDLAEYVRVNSNPGSIRAGFQYYATGLREDTVNLKNATQKLTIPVLAWGGAALLRDIVPAWKTVAENVTGGAVPECGHFIPEEKPEFVIEKALEFFAPLKR